MELLGDPQRFYRRGDAKVKRAFLKMVFERRTQDTEGVEDHTPSAAFEQVMRARRT